MKVEVVRQWENSDIKLLTLTEQEVCPIFSNLEVMMTITYAQEVTENTFFLPHI